MSDRFRENPQTYNSTYLSSAGYTANFVFNLLTTATLTTGGSTYPLVSNLYDTACGFNNCYLMGAPGNSAPVREYDANPPVPFANRGMLIQTSNPLKWTTMWHYPWGTFGQSLGSDGVTTTASAGTGTNYAAPDTITAQSYNETIGYTSWLGVAQSTGANGEHLSMQYDAYGRPMTGTSAYGAATNFTYATSAPFWQKETGPSGVTTTTLDGFGRAVRAASGDTTGEKAWTDSVYAPCACSPLGKLQKISQPYPANGSVAGWTTYTYDGLGRTLSVQQPDGASTTHYAYAGSQTTVTDPAGKWKQMTSDVEGNMITVVEPDPCVTSNTLTTSYSYDWMKNLTLVTMARPNVSWSGTTCTEPGGTTTQTRTFVYDTAGHLTSATNPENGTVTYTYSGDVLYKKHDAKGIDTVYNYDSLKRVTAIQRYPNGVTYNQYNQPQGEDWCQRVTFTYDGYNPVNPGFSQASYGRLTTAQYYLMQPGAFDDFNTLNACPNSVTEMYSYHPAGAVIAKHIDFWNVSTQQDYGNLEADYTYDTAGRETTVGYPAWGGQLTTFTTTYDSMGRPSTTGSGSGVQYDFAGRETTTINAQTKTYNVNGQLASMGSQPGGNVTGGVQYVYSGTQNNGQITQAVDTISGETITYQYDSLKRLISASSTPTTGSSATPWTQSFQYDGFGNMTGKTLNGTTTPMPVNSATNRLTYATYDANGNMTSGAGVGMAYDAANRISAAGPTGGGAAWYGYDPSNRRIGDMGHFTFYGARGEKLGVYGMYYVCDSAYTDCNAANTNVTVISTNVWFAGRLVWDSSAAVFQDRVGTNRVSGARFYPYGEEITSTSNDRVKFGTYTRDSLTGLDYADQRFYASTYGRFNTADPATSSARANAPLTWNRYGYTDNDPINKNDPTGLDPDPCAELSSSGDLMCAAMWASVGWYPGSDGGAAQGGDGTTSSPYEWGVAFSATGTATAPSNSSSNSEGNSDLGLSFSSFMFGSSAGGGTGGGSGDGSSINLGGVASAVVACAADHYGLTGVAAGVGALGLPIPKTWVFGRTAALSGVSETMSLSSTIERLVFNGSGPKLGVALLGTTRVFGIIGRAAPIVSAALLAYDAASIGYCAYKAQSGGANGQP